MYRTQEEQLYLTGLGQASRSKRGGRRACANDRLPNAYLRVVPCIEYPETANDPILIQSSQTAAAVFRATVPVDARQQELFLVMLLDARNQVLGIDVVAAGGVDAAAIDNRLVFQSACMLGATGLILGHNHPSGSTQPSQADLVLTQRLVQGAGLLGMAVLDHIVLGRNDSYFSMLDAGMLPAAPRPSGLGKLGKVKVGNKDMQQLIRQAEDLGVRVEKTGGNHLVFYTPSGPVYTASTPSDRRSVLNARSRLRRSGVPIP